MPLAELDTDTPAQQPRPLTDGELTEYAGQVLAVVTKVLEANRPPLRVRALAACRDEPPSTFFPERGGNHQRARRVCAGCPVLAECGAWAERRGADLHGVWAGLTRAERRGEESPPTPAKPLTWADGTPRGRW